jgi:hypothetical protein
MGFNCWMPLEPEFFEVTPLSRKRLITAKLPACKPGMRA